MRWLLAALCAPLAALGVGGPAAAAGGEDAVIEHVVIVGVPGLEWSDVSRGGTPQLWSAAESGSIGALTVRAARSVTCVLDGWVTLGAGNRARFVTPPVPLAAQPDVVAPDGPDVAQDELGGCLPQEEARIDLAAVVAASDGTPPVADDNSYGARPGALGTAVECATGVGRGPVLALRREGTETQLLATPPASATGWAAVVARCPLTVVSMPELIGAVDRVGALATLDERLGLLRSGLPPATELIIVGNSETGLSNSSLHVAIDVGPGVQPGFLTSASTGRVPYVQLIDVAPTALDRLGLDQPPAMVGQPLQPGQPRPQPLAEAVAELTDANIAARAQGTLTSTFFWILVVLISTLCLLGMLLVRRGGRIPTTVRSTALVVATLPAATFLANLAPWWRASTPVLLAGLMVGAMTAMSVLALRGPWSTRPLGPELVVAAVTLATLAADVLLLESRLQLSSLLGYNPIVAGRFSGFGNIPFGIYATSALLVTIAVVRAAPPTRQPIVLGVAAVTVVTLNGAPGLGNDFGGVLALVPAFAVFALVLRQLRPTPGRLALAGLAGAVVVATIAVVDFLRPASEQTHFGRFVGQLLDGSALTIVQRKAESNVGILLHSPLTLLIPVFAVTLWLLLRPGGELHPLLARREMRAGLAAVAVAGLIGAVVNDSGIAVPVAAGWLLVPLALSAAAARRCHAGPQVPNEPGVAAPVRRRQGVTVNSRDSAGPAD